VVRVRRELGRGGGFRSVFPLERVRQAEEEFLECLSRHPPTENDGGDISGLPPGFASILGFYATDLLALMVALRFEAIKHRPSRRADRAGA
jgi:hypothetical protein